MEDLVLSVNDSLEDNILAIIDFVKQVEKENGLTEEQIEHKYSCGCCAVLALELIKENIERLFGTTKELEGFAIETGNKKINTHSYLKLKKDLPEEDLYFDIFGKKTIKEVKKFISSKFWDKEFLKPWVAKFEKENNLGQYMYVQEACYTRIKVEGLTV